MTVPEFDLTVAIGEVKLALPIPGCGRLERWTVGLPSIEYERQIEESVHGIR